MTYHKAPPGEPDFTKESITVGMMTIEVIQRPISGYHARLTLHTGRVIEGRSAAYPNGAMQHLLEEIIRNPILDGRV